MTLGSMVAAKPTAAPVDLGQPLQIRLHPRPGVDRARLELNLGFELAVVDRVVSFESHAIDDRVLDHSDDQRASFPPNGHVGEQAGREQALEGLVDRIGIEFVARANRHIGPYGVHLDAHIALDEDGPDRALLCRRSTDPQAEDERRQPELCVACGPLGVPLSLLAFALLAGS